MLFVAISKISYNSNFQIIKIFLKKYLSFFLTLEYINFYINFYDEIQKKNIENKKYNQNFSTLKIVIIANKIKNSIDKYQRMLLVINLIELVNYYEPLIFLHKDKKQIAYDAILTIAEILKIPTTILEKIYHFIMGNFFEEIIRENILTIDKTPNKYFKHLEREGLNSKIYVLFIEEMNIYILTKKNVDTIFLNGKELKNNYINIFRQGDILKNDLIEPIFYSQIEYIFLENKQTFRFEFFPKNIIFNYPKSKVGIKEFSFINKNSELVGILGSSGVGKTTLLNLLCGKLKAVNGEILFNGQNINKIADFNNHIGYISQDDILIEELSVYQNLYFNCKLVFADKSDIEIDKIINKILSDFELLEIKNNKIGNILNKKISGGQRKRVNLAMEFLRETIIMFIDEPTSGLSSSDSLNIIHLLKIQSLHGKLIYVNIHQPSSEILKLFDKIIVLDKEGYVIYSGNPVEAISYFKKEVDFVDTNAYECDNCQSLNPEKILQIIEAKKINESGDYIPERMIIPKEWNTKYKENIESKINPTYSKTENELPKIKFAGKIQQFFIYLKRSINTKISDIQYIIILLAEVPILAFLLSFLSKNFNISENNNIFEYTFQQNENIPAFFFMSIVVALFYGLSISSEEIFRDRKILERERFLKLSRNSYLLSKVFFHMINSMIQMFLYVFISSKILLIEDFNFKFWIIMFSVSFCSNLLGLNISDGLKNIVSIYIIIPLLLIPQLLLSGVIIKFDKLHKSVENEKYVPVIADFMISRWAYEALLVEQFQTNKYNQIFFDLKKEIDNKTYYSYYYIPQLLEVIDNLQQNKNLSDTILLKNEIAILSEIEFYFTNFTDKKIYDIQNLEELKSTLQKYSKLLNIEIDSLNIENDYLLQNIGISNVIEMKSKCTNDKINEMVLNSLENKKIVISNSQIIRKYEPIYQNPENKFGRTQFLVSEKLAGNYLIQTFFFNLIVIPK